MMMISTQSRSLAMFVMLSVSLTTLIQTKSKSDDQVSFLVYNLCLPFAATVAHELNVPSALLLIQSATSFSIYNRFCNKRDGVVVMNNDIETSISLKLPGLPLFNWGDFPTFVLPTSPYFSDMISVYQDHIELLKQHPNSCVLVNTLDGLQPESIKTINNVIVIGPLVPTSISSNRGSYFKWLDTKHEKSVVYVSFGSLAVLTKAHKKELLHGLIECGHPFLLVLRDNAEYEEDVEINVLREKLGEDGLIVGWCEQMEVLRHQAIGCFVTHCGWNSTLESMVAGVAIVGCPQFSDPKTNAKMEEEVWRNGVRVMADDAVEAPVAGREEIKRCLKEVMGGGDRAEEIQKNVEKWKKVAEKSLKDGGTSQRNLKLFMENISIN